MEEDKKIAEKEDIKVVPKVERRFIYVTGNRIYPSFSAVLAATCSPESRGTEHYPDFPVINMRPDTNTITKYEVQGEKFIYTYSWKQVPGDSYWGCEKHCHCGGGEVKLCTYDPDSDLDSDDEEKWPPVEQLIS